MSFFQVVQLCLCCYSETAEVSSCALLFYFRPGLLVSYTLHKDWCLLSLSHTNCFTNFFSLLFSHGSSQQLLVKINSIPMASDLLFIIQQANGSQQDTVVNATAGSIKFKSTTGGILLAYGSLVIMALIPVVVGSYKSIAHHRRQKKMSEVC